jgi:hypothetical protein
MVVVGEMPHAQILPAPRAEVGELAGDHRGRLAAYRRHRTVGYATTVSAMTGRAIAVQVGA